MTYNHLAKICGALSLLSPIGAYWIGWGNFGVATFFVFLGFGVLFNSLDAKEREIEMLRYEMHNLAFGSAKEKEEAQSYATGQVLLLEVAKKEMIKKYDSKPNE